MNILRNPFFPTFVFIDIVGLASLWSSLRFGPPFVVIKFEINVTISSKPHRLRRPHLTPTMM